MPARKLRKRDAAHVQEVARAIQALVGFCVPILIGKDKLILDGEIRFEAAKLLGLSDLPCIRIDHLSDDEQRLLRLAVNRLGEKGQWDLGELRIEMEELILADAPIEISGFSMPEIVHIVLGEEAEAVEQGPLAPDPETAAVARVGDVFQFGRHRVICGDATAPATFARLASGPDADWHAKLLVSLIWTGSSGAPNHIFPSGIRTLSEAASQSFEADLIRTGADEITRNYDIRRRTI